MSILRRTPKPAQPVALTITIEQCDRKGCQRKAAHHITYDMSMLGTIHQALCPECFAVWLERHRKKEGE